MSVLFIIYVNDYYHASTEMNHYLKSDSLVKVKKIKEGYFFDGSGEDEALIFYPGAKVEASSYSRIMYELSSNGIDCFLLEMPFHLAFFGINKPDKIIKDYKYDRYILSGHSLGGIAATSYLLKNQDKIDTIIYLASYPNKKLPDSTKSLSIYGSNDQVLSMESYNKSKNNFSSISREEIIKGANHANFANYGNQKGDGKATISKIKQQDLTVEYIKDFVNN